MDTPERRPYNSPLREARARETRERILEGVAAWIQRDSPAPFTLEAIAEEAGVERRTLFRHFATKEALLEAFWQWINHRITPRTLPDSLDDLIAGPREAFARFDDQEGVIRASLHTPAGRAMRLAAIEPRRKAFRAALREVTREATPKDRRRIEALAHALYSAAAWEAMRDYAGLDGKQAGDAASWALQILIDAVRRSPADSSNSSQP